LSANFYLEDSLEVEFVEYLIPSDNIIGLDCHFNVTKKSNVTGRL